VDGRRAVGGMLSSHCLAWDGLCVQDRRVWREVREQWEGENENGSEHRRTRSGSSRRDGDMRMEGRRVYRI
jgi:hypothetical protein